MTGYATTGPFDIQVFKSTSNTRHRRQCEMTILLTLKGCKRVELCKPGCRSSLWRLGTDQRRNRVTGYAALAKPVSIASDSLRQSFTFTRHRDLGQGNRLIRSSPVACKRRSICRAYTGIATHSYDDHASTAFSVGDRQNHAGEHGLSSPKAHEFGGAIDGYGGD